MNVFLGFDHREVDGYAVTKSSILKHTPGATVYPLVLNELQDIGLYARPTRDRYDIISQAPMSTEFAISRFLVPTLAKHYGLSGWVLFMDCDMLIRDNLNNLASVLNDDYAVACVKHQLRDGGADIKMDGCLQTYYERKNWSSVLAFNLDHPANIRLDTHIVNTWPGRDLHALKWLEDGEIQDLAPEWNHLVGVLEPNPAAKIVHYTLGIPRMNGYRDCEFSTEWFNQLYDWAGE